MSAAHMQSAEGHRYRLVMWHLNYGNGRVLRHFRYVRVRP